MLTILESFECVLRLQDWVVNAPRRHQNGRHHSIPLSYFGLRIPEIKQFFLRTSLWDNMKFPGIIIRLLFPIK